MNDLRTAAQQALEALEADNSKLWPSEKRTTAIAALRAALAQQAEPEPLPPEQRQRWEELAAMPQQAEPRSKCGETCERAKLCATCAQVLAQQAEGGGNLPPPLQEPKDFDHGIGADRFRVVRGAFWWHVLIGDSPTKRGKFHTQAGAEEMAALLLREFRNGAFVQYEAALAQQEEPVATLAAQRDALLEALRDLVQLEADGRTEYESAIPHWGAARAAIKAVEGEKV